MLEKLLSSFNLIYIQKIIILKMFFLNNLSSYFTNSIKNISYYKITFRNKQVKKFCQQGLSKK